MIKIQVKKSNMRLFIALAFVVAVVSLPWPNIFSDLYGFEYIDREVYREYFLYKTNILEYTEFTGIASYVSSEFLWHYGVRFLLENTGLEIEQLFFLISIGIVLAFSLLLVRWKKTGYIIFLLNPLVVDFAFSQLRLALALTLLIAAFLLKEKSKFAAVLCTILTLFIHTASILFLVVYFADMYLSRPRWRRLTSNTTIYFIIVLGIGFFIGILIGPARDGILAAMGDRRVGYSGLDSSLKYLLFWMALIIPFYIDRVEILKRNYSRYPIVLIGLLFINFLTSGYSTRFIAASMPFVIGGIAEMRGVIKIGTCLLFVFYTFLQWLYWLRIVGV